MLFKVLSHAGLLVQNKAGKTLLFDPWLIGSSYWRSWWNYPPVSRELVASIKPDFIYLTHIHWDHFHGPSLEKFSKETPIIVPKGNYERIKRDLNFLGFNNVIELNHGQCYQIAEGFTLTSYQFWMFLDSAALVECDGVTLLNLNDSKHMGPTLKQIVKRHQPIDFVFRSHSSANERLSYEIVDDPNAAVDDLESYIREFALTVCATGARYAVPFASNHCHLHKDSFHFNKYIQHPILVEQYFQKHGIEFPKVKIMVSGDSWNSNKGFAISEKDWFTDREEILLQYRNEISESLNLFYKEEDQTIIKKQTVEKYFAKLSKSIPFPLRWYFRKQKFTYVLFAQDKPKYIFVVDISKGTVEELNPEAVLSPETHPIQIHTTAFIFLRGIKFHIFSHMCIGKRVFYKVTKKRKGYMELLNLVFNCYEYELFPLRRNFTVRSLKSWSSRWRELWLYAMVATDYLFKGSVDISKYLKPAPANPIFKEQSEQRLAIK